MEDNERKKLVWIIKKGLFRLSADELLQLATDVPYTPDQDSAALNKQDEEGCIDYICSYMGSALLLGLEDQGMSELLHLNDRIIEIIEKRSPTEATGDGGVELVLPAGDVSSHLPQNTAHIDIETADLTSKTEALESQLSRLISSYNTLCQNLKHTSNQPTANESCQPHSQTTLQSPQAHPVQHLPLPPESLIALKDLPLLQRKEFKIQGGQIGDHASDITYSSISKQIDRGLKDRHTEGEIVQAVLRIIKPGIFKDMLASKDEMSITELKSFLQSHLGEKSSTELFQGLINAKQHDHETPQQFLYRMMGLRQKVLFTSKQTDSDIKYEAQTVQNAFLHTVYQGLNEKDKDIRQELKPLLSDPIVTDDALVKQITKTTNEESERKRRLGRATRPKAAQAQSNETDHCDVTKVESHPDSKAKYELIHQLSAQVQALTQVVSSLQAKDKDREKLLACESRPQCTCQHPDRQHTHLRKGKRYGCPNCTANHQPNCNHCFACGEEGHRALGCMKRTKQQGNGPRSQQRDLL